MKKEDLKLLKEKEKARKAARKKYFDEYRKTQVKQFNITFVKTKDKDIIEFLESKDNQRAYIINLIRKDMLEENNQ